MINRVRKAHSMSHFEGTGTITNDDSGEIFLAFSTANQDASEDTKVVTDVNMVPNDSLDPLFEAIVGATEEAIINAMIAAETLTGRGGNNTATAITTMTKPSLVDVMKKYNRWVQPAKSRTPREAVTRRTGK